MDTQLCVQLCACVRACVCVCVRVRAWEVCGRCECMCVCMYVGGACMGTCSRVQLCVYERSSWCEIEAPPCNLTLSYMCVLA